ncbi:hypothetical protein M758_UG125500 [Ceratodon purpureus]|nr:hypothetical protein M758_UG125500 [Ceratodon purpureus]
MNAAVKHTGSSLLSSTPTPPTSPFTLLPEISLQPQLYVHHPSHTITQKAKSTSQTKLSPSQNHHPPQNATELLKNTPNRTNPYKSQISEPTDPTQRNSEKHALKRKPTKKPTHL